MAFNNFMFDEVFDFHKTMDESIGFSDDTWSSCLPSDERWPPLGAAMDDNVDTEGRDETEDIETLQKEQEQLNSSLFALTSHFAQVQFRLKQIVSAPKQDQEKLLKELEDFAFQACPEVKGPNDKKVACTSCATHVAYEMYEKRVEAEEDKQRMLSEHLRMLLDELQKYASRKEEKIDANLFSNKPQVSKTEKHGFLVEQLRTKLNVGPDELDAMSPEDLKNQIDKAVAKLVNPGKAKEQLLNQLTTQIKDMESFVEFLKGNQELKLGINIEDGKKTKRNNGKTGTDNKSMSTGVLSSPYSLGASVRASSSTGHIQTQSGIPAPHIRIMQLSEEKRKRLQGASIAIMKKALSILQIFAISQFGCSARHFEEHMMRKASATASSMGYQTPLTNLRVAIDRIISLHNRLYELGVLHPDTEDNSGSPVLRKRWSKTRNTSHSSQTSTRSRSSSISSINSDISSVIEKTAEDNLQEELIHVVRGDLASSLQQLFQHGLCKSVERSVLTTKGLIGCMASKRLFAGKLHVWELFQEFYKLKHGINFNNQPNVKLSEAFGVDLGGTRETPKQSLLTELHKIKSTHEPRKRSYDSMYKALICSSLNQQRLLLWIRLIARSPELIERHYERWSYMARTGFDEVLNQVERLTELNFYLPEDLAIRHLLKSYNEFGDPY